MIVYRVGKTRYAQDLTGEGARLHGGRWNHKLTACIYTAESRSLATLEYTVNTNIEDIPRSLSITTYEIPDDGILYVRISELPGNWKEAPAPSATKDFGTRLLKEADYPVIRFPSTIIPYEFNYILNPLHPNSDDFQIVDIRDFVYDVRIKRV
ncbi:RES family NAD+ phosphorylase [Pseudoflavitalea sp. X16]|uniref:RES family NAD+ phosphorylase n=1 Tax=Paraflavitalea devenefica TaxID=2716334 RepID=UPI001423F723|nr:RES family NAD+ phosphorylase [Paraflavitalea devenefica]NII28585.1 RES family NAD+ phosphorylase [Paraflavitalea devenefica]